MKTVYKYPLPLKDEVAIEMPEDREILHVGADPSGGLCVWALVDPSSDTMTQYFLIRGTGHPLDDDIGAERHAGSAVCPPFVWHVFLKGGA